MKVLIIACFVAVTLAEPPSYRQQFQGDRTYYFAKQQEAQEPEQADAPYPASGWKPEGPAFELPQKQQQQVAPVKPIQQYGAPAQPQQQYGAPIQPQEQYGAPVQPQKNYGTSAQPQKNYGTPAQPQKNYGTPAQPPKQYGTPAAPQKQFGTPAKQFGAQPAAQKQYGAPAQPQIQYAVPQRQTSSFAAPQKQYGAPAQPQNQYGFPAQPQNQYGFPAQPDSQYGVPAEPQNEYGVPAQPQQYGAPEYTTIEPETATDYEESNVPQTGTESQAEPVESVNELEDEGDVDAQQRESGQYYVALPDGRLQRVQYVSSQDIEAMKYFAKIRAENVEPLRGPVYAYQPLQKLQFAPSQLAISAEQPILAIRENAPKNLKIQAAPAKLQVNPLAAELPSAVVAPVSSPYTSYTNNYQVPEQRYLVTF